ncbi:hypothetical protein PGTUg99_036866 [Puccinia graminis f. sp. tritici]|uniref:Uncharacterized protein n=1 Tax=Puccinia graminis f. sp. tritici TaxID=56615 RepID=A0A5B0SF93_PUCGR|nr:hypothetical protein PGTUg99_036866 [Puccinia graminis f. sp. tritici]
MLKSIALVFMLMALSCTSRPFDTRYEAITANLGEQNAIERPEPREYDQDLTDNIPMVIENPKDLVGKDSRLLDTHLVNTERHTRKSYSLLEVGGSPAPISNLHDLPRLKSESQYASPVLTE